MNLLTNLGFRALEAVSGLTPANPYVAQAQEIENKINTATEALINQNNNDPVFREKLTQIRTDLQSQKQAYEARLLELNGRYFQDAQSPLKQAWDTVVRKVRAACEMVLKGRQDLTLAQQKMETYTYLDAGKVEASQSIDNYIALERERNQLTHLLHELVRIEKASALNDELNAALQNQITTLQTRQIALCGKRYQDPNGLLDKAWKQHKQALAKKNAIEAPKLLNAFRKLDEERKNNDAKLFELKKQLLLSQGPKSITLLTVENIKKEIDTLSISLVQAVEKSKQNKLPELDFTM
jgi:hypothetical protein